MGTEKGARARGLGRHHLLFEQRHHWGNGCDWGLTLGQACVATFSHCRPREGHEGVAPTGLGALFFAYYWDE